ncbi:MAG: hypothetical protein IKW83_07610 [Muribaculaceae bacterium]|nr:hypothetical protein [Muribaculaceae bacterium]
MIAIFCVHNAHAQNFAINQKSDSLWVLSLSDDSGSITGSWQLPYPVYRFATADIDGDGSTDAVVGVFKASRYFTTPSRRVFIFKNFGGKVRPLWLGSRLGGDLVDFVVVGRTIRAIEKTDQGYAVSDYIWKGFGMGFHSLVATCDTLDESFSLLEQ